MSKYQLSQALQEELKKINAQIDFKIVKGLSYQREAWRHRKIVHQLDQLRPASMLFFFR